jgi:hypothetical protein
MPNTSKMTADEYLAHCERLAQKKTADRPEPHPWGPLTAKSQEVAESTLAQWKMMNSPPKWIPPKPQGESMSQFKPGQTVWRKRDGEKFKVSKWTNDEYLVLIDSANFTCGFEWDEFTAIDPNAKPEPQKPNCPFCGVQCEMMEDPFYAQCVNSDCQASGPIRDTWEEAVSACRIKAGPIDMERLNEACKDALPILQAAREERERCAQQYVEDATPLTEEWLRKAGLWSGGMGQFHANFGNKGFFLPWRGKTVGDARAMCRLLGVDLKE